MNLSPVLGYIRTTKKEKTIIIRQEITINDLQRKIQQLKDKIKNLSQQSTNNKNQDITYYENQNIINKNTISLLINLVRKQSCEINKTNNIYVY